MPAVLLADMIGLMPALGEFGDGVHHVVKGVEK